MSRRRICCCKTARTLKIADFEVAQIEAQSPRDMTGNTGTLGYMAPEVLNGKAVQ
ncbi:hypothetical protein PHJA_000478600 [Phtheirospermum japonicum]|uniref:Protein kinase domain-containing protein n=1 Tax=Phtheirospermum japonicum TaxID=374723 RepID=A0A830BBC4_9LAMI|nr:hypothetical protein PHJA_000478600 [Phtheirospermum japonicum]